jgi:cbb3-type cytochrome oxidase maturation protein
LNQAGLQPGLYIAFLICGIFFVAGVAAMWWAFKSGEFEDIESSKFDMLDDGDSAENATRARAAVDRVRAKAQS